MHRHWIHLLACVRFLEAARNVPRAASAECRRVGAVALYWGYAWGTGVHDYHSASKPSVQEQSA